MAHQIDFSQLAEYDAGQTGISIEASIQLNDEPINFLAKIDTGSTNCIFTRQAGEKIGLKIEDGLEKWIGTATGKFLTYEHEVTLSVLGFHFDILACFADNESFDKNILGRYGFLMQVKIALIDYEGKIYLSQYANE
jgi:predicted aspartyl protease